VFTARYGLDVFIYIYNSGYVFYVDLRTNSDCCIIHYNIRKTLPRAEVMSVCLSLQLGSSFGASRIGQFSFKVDTGDFHCRC
jgi:hypothetical protein